MVYRPIQLVSLTSINFRDGSLAGTCSRLARAFHLTLISSQPQALSPATRRVIIKPAGRHTQTDASSSGPDALIQHFSEHSQPRPGARVVCRGLVDPGPTELAQPVAACTVQGCVVHDDRQARRRRREWE